MSIGTFAGLDKEGASILDVFLHGEHIGRLWRWPNSRQTFFQYDQAYLKRDVDALGIGLPLKREPQAHEGLHPYFANLISEGWLRDLQNRTLNVNAPERVSRFDILAHFGRDCFGAISVGARTELPETKIALIDEVEQLIHNTDAVIPGAKPKLLVIKNPDGIFRIARSHETSTHIAKLPIHSREYDNLLENEYLSNIAVAALLPEDKVCEMHMGYVDDIDSEVLLIKRFDRTETGHKIDFRDFAQLYNMDPDKKFEGHYADISAFISIHAQKQRHYGILTNKDDVLVLFKRIIASFLIGNSDTHLKNFALMQKGDEFRLTPNFDLLAFSGVYKGRSYKEVYDSALSIGVMGKPLLRNLKPKHIAMLAIDMGLTPSETILCLREIEARIPDALAALAATEYNEQGSRALPYRIGSTIRARWNGSCAISQIAFYLAKTSMKRVPKIMRHRVAIRSQARSLLLHDMDLVY